MPRMFTKGRKVELRDMGGASFAPPVMLPPLTEVEVLSSEFSLRAMALRGMTWVQVKVVAPLNLGGKVGVVPFSALDEFALSTFAYDRARTSFTGASYGADTLLWDGQENRLWKPNCPHCGGDPKSHRLLETRTGRPDTGNLRIPGTLDRETAWSRPNQDARSQQDMINHPRGQGTMADVLQLYDALLATKGTAKSGFASGTQVMIGVLHCEDDTVFAGYSGSPRTGFEEVAKSLGFVPAPPDLKWPLRTRTGATAAHSLQHRLADLVCAAPRLVQCAIKAGKWPYAMSEVWFNPNDKHAKYPDMHTIESCDRCRDTLPLMLCPQ